MGLPRRPLFGLLLAPPLAAAEELATHVDLGGEGLGMVRAIVLDLVARERLEARSRQLLQARLVVERRVALRELTEHLGEEALDQVVGGREPLIEVDRTEDRLEHVPEDRLLVRTSGRGLATPELDVGAELEVPGDLCQGLATHGSRTQLREPALLLVGMRAVDLVGDDEPEHSIPEELQPLVGR